ILLGVYVTRDVIALRKTVVSYGQGDFSARSSIKSRDEVGSLARSFNTMIETITGYQDKLVAAEREKATAELASKVEGARNAENRKYLDNISQGLLMLDENLRIGEQYSASLVRLFRYPGNPAGQGLLDFVYPDAEKNVTERAELTSFLDILINNTTADQDMLDEINPIKDRELRAYDGSTIFVDARFLRIHREDAVENVMVMFEDKSGLREVEKKLTEERDRYDGELEAIAAILKNGPVLFKDFVAEGETLTAEFAASLGDLRDPERSASFMRQFHSFKGLARSLQLGHLAQSAHRIEDLLLAARGDGGLVDGQPQALRQALDSMIEGIATIKQSVERFSAFQKQGDPTPRIELEASIRSFSDMVVQLAREMNKDVLFEPAVDVTELPFLKELKNPIIHLLRNAMDHGMEDLYERTASGKPAKGRIRLEIGKEGSEVRVAVRDDGKGIDFERIRRKAVQKGLLAEGNTATNDELLKILFLADFSTKDGVSEISGRGVGLDAVLHVVRQLGGTIKVTTTRGAGTCFLLTIPLKRASDASGRRAPAETAPARAALPS
ncbi:MAG TPA: ATP-binding protein, partial [Spirochaetia bacterium]|nr:ATP-binding protein [Spirochaetia bacterium]